MTRWKPRGDAARRLDNAVVAVAGHADDACDAPPDVVGADVRQHGDVRPVVAQSASDDAAAHRLKHGDFDGPVFEHGQSGDRPGRVAADDALAVEVDAVGRRQAGLEAVLGHEVADHARDGRLAVRARHGDDGDARRAAFGIKHLDDCVGHVARLARVARLAVVGRAACLRGEFKGDVLDDVAEVCSFVKSLDEAVRVALRAVVFTQARQERDDALDEARHFPALAPVEVFEVEPHQKRGPVAVDVRAGQRSYAPDSHLRPPPRRVVTSFILIRTLRRRKSGGKYRKPAARQEVRWRTETAEKLSREVHEKVLLNQFSAEALALRRRRLVRCGPASRKFRDALRGAESSNDSGALLFRTSQGGINEPSARRRQPPNS
jgi:hypothetical protein